MSSASVQCYSPSDYFSLPAGPSTWLLRPIIPASGSAILWGDPKTGKSSLAVQLVLALISPTSFLGFTPDHQARVLYLQIDAPRSLWRERLGLITAPPPDWDRWLRLADKQTCPYPFNIRHLDHAVALKDAVAAWSPELVIVDTLRESYRGSENDTDIAQQTFSSFVVACHPSAILYVHHGKKPPSDASIELGHMESSRGSTYYTGAVDTTLSLKAYRPTTDKATGRQVTRGKLTIKGRAIGDEEIKLVQDPSTFLWHLPTVAPDPFHDAIVTLLADTAYDTDRARAEALHAAYPQHSLEACKMAISRARKGR